MDLVAELAQMNNRARNSNGLGILPVVAVAVFILPVIWTYGPKVFGSPIDVTPDTQTRWFTFRSTEGPFEATSADPCKTGDLVSKFKAGSVIAWTSDLTIEANVRVQTQVFIERLADRALMHTVTIPNSGVRRDGVRTTCYQTPKDLGPGLYALHRVVHFFPPDGADFEKEWPVVPFEVTG